MFFPLFAAFSFLLGPEIQSSTPVIEPAHTAWQAQIASDGRDYLVHWLDTRGDGRFAEVTNDGVVTPRGGSPSAVFGSLGWNGSDYEMVINPFYEALQITRIDRSGHPIDTTPARAAPGLNVTRFLVSGPRTLAVGGAPWLASVFGPAGNLIRSVPISGGIPVALASNDNAFAVLSSSLDDGALSLTRISRDGVPLDATPIGIGVAPLGFFRLASDGVGWMVARVDAGVNVPPYAAHFMALSADGIPRGGLTTIALPGNRAVGAWDVVWSGTAYVFACAALDDHSVWHATLGHNAEIVSPPEEIATSGGQDVALASNGSSALLTWGSPPFLPATNSPSVMTPDGMSAQLFDADGARRGTAFPMTWSAAPQARQEIAWDGSELLAVWAEASGLFMGRLSGDGTPLDGRGREIVSTTSDLPPFAVAYDGSRFVVAWGAGPTVMALRVRTDGTVDGEPVVAGGSLLRPYGVPALACDGRGGCLITWTDASFIVRGVLLRGESVVGVNALPSTPDVYRSPAVTFDGHEYVVAFQSGDEVEVLRVSGDGKVIDPIPFAVAHGFTPAVAWSEGDTGLLVWFSVDDDHYSLRAAAFDRDLRMVSDAHPIGRPYDDLHVAFDGKGFLVTFLADWRTTVMTAISPEALAGATARFSDARQARVAAVGTGRALLTYVHPDPDGVSRAYVRTVNDIGDAPVHRRPAR